MIPMYPPRPRARCAPGLVELLYPASDTNLNKEFVVAEPANGMYTIEIPPKEMAYYNRLKITAMRDAVAVNPKTGRRE